MQTAPMPDDFRPQFSGHETFPLRLLWLKKAHDAVTLHGAIRRTFQEPSSIGRFGVGKNMAIAMRHWAVASGMLADQPDAVFAPTSLASQLFDDESGYDPYLEDPATLWLIHLALAGTPECSTTFFYAFNHLNQTVFDRDGLCQTVGEFARKVGARATAETIKRDVEVFLRSYVSRGEAGEDAAEPLLTELGLIREQRLANQFEFARGPKVSLPDAVFAIALQRFWKRWHASAPTISAEQSTYEPGSPGRVFKLDEESVLARLARIDEITEGALRWTDTAGLRQVSFDREVPESALVRASFKARCEA